MTAPWAPQHETATVVDGDILTPLARVRDQYLRRAARTQERAYGDKKDVLTEVAAGYRQSAEAVDRLITLGNCQTNTSLEEK